MRHHYIIYLLIFGILATFAPAQEEDVYLDMSLEELFDVEVMVTASKKPEDLFEAPLSVTIIKHEDIVKSGANSIPEALRLAPGLIVREQTPGNFDVHIRGYDDVTRNFMFPVPTNSIILVMIDNRVVYNYFSGGTFWEALPIDINDVEQIEVVRGPASALYGPNAAAGVINIITSRPDRNGLYKRLNASAGTEKSVIANGSIGYKWNDKATFSITGNMTSLSRLEDQYFSWYDMKYLHLKEITSLMLTGIDPETGELLKMYESGFQPVFDVNRAMEKYGANAYFTYNFSRESALSASYGTQRSKSQKAYYNNFFSPLSDYDSQSSYYDLKTNYKDLHAQVSYIDGNHDNNLYWLRYSFNTWDAILEYDWVVGKFSLRPNVSYRVAKYRGALITDDIEMTPENLDYAPKQQRIISSTAFGFLADFKPSNKWRFIYGLRADNYNINDRLSLTGEMSSTYRFNKNNLARIVISRANRAPFMIDSFIGNRVAVAVWLEEYGAPGEIRFAPNTNTKYLSLGTIELGLRKKLSPKLQLDVEAFASVLDQFIDLEIQAAYIDTVTRSYPVYAQDVRFQNSETYNAYQNGLAFTIDYKPSSHLSARFYGTYQNTFVDYNEEEVERITRKGLEFTDTPYTEAYLDSLVEDATEQDPHSTTPAFFGGFWLNYSPVERVNFNINAYYMHSQVYEGIHIEKTYFQDVPAYTVLNAKISYRIAKSAALYLNMRNILGKHREFGFVDRIGRTFLIGLRLDSRRW